MRRERRKSKRVRVDLQVDYSCEDTFLFAYMTDISAVGVFIRSGNPYPPGTLMTLRFSLPGDERPVVLEGEVMWTQRAKPDDARGLHPGMGIRFVDLADGVRERLAAIVRQGGAIGN